MIIKPTFLVDEEKCRANIRAMAAKAKVHNLEFRPHFKTHQSDEVGSWFHEEGISKITVSSLDMASQFDDDGWNDITVAFPVNTLEIDTINHLATHVNLNLLVESVDSVKLLSRGLNQKVGLFIKIDIGTHRTGISPTDTQDIRSVINCISEQDRMHFEGFLMHAGHSYRSRGENEVLDVHQTCLGLISKLRNDFQDLDGITYSYGDTPTCSIAQSFSGVDEIRPGNFTFYDLMMVQIGACAYDQIAVAMACPVVAKHPERNEVVIYGGGVHFSKDRMEDNGQTIFGKVVESVGDKWGSVIDGAILHKISQEHGIIKAPSEWIELTAIGDIVKILPVHSCMTMDLMRDFKKV